MQKMISRSRSKSAGCATHFILLILILCLTNATAKLAAKEEAASDMASRCILNIIQTYLNETKKLALRYDQIPTHEVIVKQLFAFLQIPMMVNAEEVPIGRTLDTRIPSDATVILGGHTNITRYLQTNLYTAQTVFLTVIWDKSEIIKGIFDEFWYYNIVNTFVLLVKKEEIDVYEFMPFVKCDENDPVLLDIWTGNGFKYGKMNRLRIKYPVSSLNGCQVNVSVSHLPPTIIFPNQDEIHGSYDIDGIEGKLLKTMSQRLNSTFLYKVSDDEVIWGFVYPHPVGPTGDLYLKKSYFSGGGPSYTLDRMPFLDLVVGTTGGTECVHWEVPLGAAKSQPFWYLIFVKEFSTTVWIYFTVILILVPPIYYSISVITKPKRGLGLFDTFLFMFSTSLGVNWRRQGNLPLNILFGAWIWYGLIIMTAYESSLRSKLTVPLSRKDIETYEELLDSGLELYALNTSIRVVFKGNENPMEKAIGERVKPWNSTIEAIVEKIITERKVAYMREHLTFSYNAFVKNNYLGKLHTMKQCIYFYIPSMYLQKNCPVTPIVDYIATGLREGGILQYWRGLYFRDSSRPETIVVKLSLEHMTAGFIAIGAGLTAATAAFIIELILYNIPKPKLSLPKNY